MMVMCEEMTVEYKIQIQHDSGGYVDKVGGTAGTAQVSGRTADAYARDHRIERNKWIYNCRCTSCPCYSR